ncbi:MAG: ELWxxDGT repeat protein, partial [Methylococcaceae bacterium]
MYFKHFKLTIPAILFTSFTTSQVIAAPQVNMLKDIWPGTHKSTQHVYGPLTPLPKPVEVNGMFYFNANDGVHGEELWQSDGTPNGTTMIKDLLPGEEGSTPNALTVIGDDIFLTTYKETIDEKKYFELIKFNTLTKEFIVLKKSEGIVWPSGHHQRPLWNSPSPFRNLTNVHGILFFFDYDEYKLSRSDGTVEGTKSMTIELPEPGEFEGSRDLFTARNWTVVNDTLVFISEGSLWKLNEEKTKAIELHESTLSSKLIKIDQTVYFSAGSTLYKYDGSGGGVTSVKQLENEVGELFLVNNTLFFTSISDANEINELWKSDGTTIGTSLLKSTGLFSNIRGFTAVGDTLYFSFSEYIEGDRAERGKKFILWKSDGSIEGTKLVKTILKESIIRRESLVNIENTLFFSIGNELWSSDGTEVGTILVKKISLADSQFGIEKLYNVNDSLFFFASDSLHGTEPWMLRENLNNDGLVTTTIIPPICETGFDPQTIKKGEGTALWWWSQNAVAGSINKGIGETTIPSDYKWIHPTETTAYTMTV